MRSNPAQKRLSRQPHCCKRMRRGLDVAVIEYDELRPLRWTASGRGFDRARSVSTLAYQAPPE